MRRCHVVPALLLVTALTAFGALRAAAEDAPADPAAAYAAKVAALPAASAEAAMRFEGVARVNGKRLGHAVFEMAPAADGSGGWEATDHVLLKPDGVPFTETATARLSKTLGLISGGVVSTKPGAMDIAWSRTDQGFHATRDSEDGEGQASDFAHGGTALTTLAATLWFLQQALPAEGKYATTIFEVEDGLDGKTALLPVELEVLGLQPFQGKQMLTATGKKADRELTVLFDPTSRQVVGVRLKKPGLTLEILAGDTWTMPAHDALAAGLRAALAFGSGDVELLDDVIYWPAVHTQILEKHPPAEGKPAPSVQELRARLLDTWGKTLPKNPAAMIQGVLEGIKDTVKQEEQEDGDVLLTFPEAFKSLQLLVGERDGVWSLVALPGL